MQNKKSKQALQMNGLTYASLTKIQAERYDQATVIMQIQLISAVIVRYARMDALHCARAHATDGNAKQALQVNDLTYDTQ